MNRTNRLQIRTPEGVVFSQTLAGPVTRFMAWLIDLAALIGAMTLVGTILGFFSLIAGEFIGALTILLYFVANLGYGIFFEWRWRGQTPGKRALRLRVVDAQGLRLKFHQVVIRNLLRAVDMLPFFYLVGGLTSVLNRRAQRLGDFAANTVVISIPKIATPNLDLIASGKFNSFREHPHLEARLRQRVSAQEAAVALQALVRRDGLEPVARVELFADLARHFQAKVQFPREATESITDEQYVRNVLDSVYRKAQSGAFATGAQNSTATKAASDPIPASAAAGQT